MAGTTVRVIFSNPQHGLNEESISSEILRNTPGMSGSHQHGAENKNAHGNHLGWVGLIDNTLGSKSPVGGLTFKTLRTNP